MDQPHLRIDGPEALRRIGHSLRTPLTAISGAGQLLSATSLTDDQREHLHTVESAVSELLEVVSDLVDASELASVGISVQSIPFRLPDVIREAVRSIRPLAADRGIELTVHGLSALPTDVIGDPGRLRQVIVHLGRNAIRFTHQGRVQVGAELVSQSEEAVSVRFAVRDTGVGIPPEDLDKIFEPFSGGGDDARPTRSGLGLALAGSVVTALGGRLTVESEVGRGSVFEFTLEMPRHTPEPGGGTSPNELERNWAMVIGDSAAVNATLSDALRQGGFEVTEFPSVPLASTTVALSDAADAAPGVVVVAPSERSFDVAKRVANDQHLSRASVLMVVPYGERGDAETCIRMGVEAYLPQPVSPVDLVEAATLLANRWTPPGQLITRHWLREQRRSLSVLVVDDSPTGRGLVIRSLEQLGHRTHAAATGREAVEKVGATAYDVILMDMEMPEMDGVEATRAIRRHETERGRRSVPIIGLSAHAFSEDRRRCLDAGMNDHVSKPFRIEHLQQVMERVSAGR